MLACVWQGLQCTAGKLAGWLAPWQRLVCEALKTNWQAHAYDPADNELAGACCKQLPGNNGPSAHSPQAPTTPTPLRSYRAHPHHTLTMALPNMMLNGGVAHDMRLCKCWGPSMVCVCVHTAYILHGPVPNPYSTNAPLHGPLQGTNGHMLAN